jgi:NADPH:quinone reductase-like Zn-dependent oxidoreductase
VRTGDYPIVARAIIPVLARLYNSLFRPKKVNVLGWEFAGQVEAIGEGVSRFKVGDDVFAWTGSGFGAHAEYRCIPEASRRTEDGIVAIKPANVSYQEAAAVPVGGLSAQGFLTKAGLKNGQSILIYGASGSVGTYAVQIAKNIGAKVTGVCSTANLKLLSALGADRVIDYTAHDISTDGGHYDVVFDAVGKLSSSIAKRILRKGGKFVSVHSRPGPIELDILDRLKDLVEAGQLRTVIDRCYSLEEIVQAHEYVERGHKKGNVIITMPTCSQLLSRLS